MKKRIRVVEDEEDNMQILRDLLAPGYELIEADNGEKALAEIRELLEREGLTFSLQFEDVDGELRVRSKSEVSAAPAGEGA